MRITPIENIALTIVKPKNLHYKPVLIGTMPQQFLPFVNGMFLFK